MSASLARPASTSSEPRSWRVAVAAAGRSTLYGAALIPLSVGSLIDVATRRPARATARWSQLRTRLLRKTPPLAAPSPSLALRAGHAVLSLLLGLVALIPIGVELLFVLRGVFYGLVDRGPYDNSWGGPTRAGAWAAHFAVGVPLLVLALVVLAGLGNLHSRLTGRLEGERLAWWVLPIAVVAAAGGAVLAVAWWHQV